MHAYPDFVKNESFYRIDSGLSLEEQQAGMLRNLKKIFNLTNASYKSMDELVNTYLVSGLEIFSMETGIVSHISDDTYTVVDVVSNHDAIKKNDEYPLEGTYCREVFQCGKVLGFPHVGKLEYMKNHPVYVNLKLESYLSAPIEVDGELYGTLNFTSTAIRENGFSEHECDLINLMANAIGNFILLRDRETRLKEANSKLKKFVGFVAHDLRNSLGAIESLSGMAERKNIPEERTQKIIGRIKNISHITLGFVHSVLELSALGSGKLEVKKSHFKVKAIKEVTLGSIEDILKQNKRNLDISADDGITIFADQKLLLQVFTNLLINAVKYSPQGSTIKFGIIDSANHIKVNISNTIDKHKDGTYSEEERYRSTGFGLEIAEEIVSAHEATLIIKEKSSLFVASFNLPKE